MASHSYYNDSNQQMSYGQAPNQNYGSSYGQDQYGSSNTSYGASQSYSQDPYSSQQVPGQQQVQGQQQGSTYADQVYPDGTREQKYDAQGQPILPNGERGLLTNLAGAAGGAYIGHKAGHGFLGAIAGGLGAKIVGDLMGKHKTSSSYGHQSGGHHGYGQGQQYHHQQQSGLAGMTSGLFGKREIDGQTGQQYQQPQQYVQQDGQYGQHGQQQYGQYGAPQQQGPYGGNDQPYGQHYGQ